MLACCSIDRAKTPARRALFLRELYPSSTWRRGCPVRLIHLPMSLRWRQLDTVLNKICREDAIKTRRANLLRSSFRIYQTGHSRRAARWRRPSCPYRDDRTRNGWNQMLTMGYGNFIAGLAVFHNQTLNTDRQSSGTKLSRGRIIMGRAVQEGHKDFLEPRVGIDNQLQFTANLCTAHTLCTSSGTPGV